MAPTYDTRDLLAVALTGAVVAAWAAAAAGAFSPAALVACEAALFSFYLAGSLLAGWRALAAGVLFDLPLRLLAGYAVVNTALFVLAWVSPLGIVANFAVLFAIIVALFAAARPVRTAGAGGRVGSVGFLALGLSLAAATLWCQDAIRPTAVDGDNVVFKPWVDGFYHAVHVRIFGAAHGWGSIEDWRMAGVPARLYHYGSYLTPAFIKQASGIPAYAAFGGILAPTGVLFTGLGAYALFGSLWGAWPGLTACAALLLLPDGAAQGMQNPFMSYHWLTQISPSGPHGLALLAVAWLFVLRGCAQGSRLQLCAGWLVGGLVVVYKAHFFIASAFLLLLVPPLFFRARAQAQAEAQAPAEAEGRAGLRVRTRALWAVAALLVFATALFVVQKVPDVPPVRFDGSGLGHVMKVVKGFTKPGALRALLDARVGLGRPSSSNLLVGGPFVLFAALGLFVPLLAVLAVRLRGRTTPLLILFPFLVTANFLTMFLGLALDFNSSTPDELSHRPFVIMYFVVVAWIGGAAGLLLVESRRLARVARPAIVGLAVVLLAVPAVLGAGVHRMWAMPMFSGVPVPSGVVAAAAFIRTHGDATDVFQDSGFDRIYTVAALAERRTYVSHTLTRIPYNSERVEERSEAVERFMQLRDPAALAATARRFGLRWFLLDPDDRVEWPADFVAHPAFEQGGFRLYRF